MDIPPDSRYYPDAVPDPDECFLRLAQELKFDPGSGEVSPDDEMPIEVRGTERRATYVRGRTTAFHPKEARASVMFGKRFPVPHRHAYFATSASLHEPAQRGTNRSLRNEEGLQPV